jgi:hypothetical protein
LDSATCRPETRADPLATPTSASPVTFQKFFPWVWVAILLLLVSGYWMVFTTFGGFTGAGLYIHLMQMIGWLMIALFIWLFHGPWLAFKRAVDVEDWRGYGTGRTISYLVSLWPRGLEKPTFVLLDHRTKRVTPLRLAPSVHLLVFVDDARHHVVLIEHPDHVL